MESAIRNSLSDSLPDLQRFAASLTGNSADAKDLVQDAAERALRRQSLFEDGTNARAWLFTIMKNIYIDKCRAQARRGHAEPLENHEAHLVDAPRQLASLEVQDLQHAMNDLPRSERELVVLAGLKGHEYERLAKQFGVAVGTIKSRLSRIRSKLRAQMDELPQAA